MKNKKLKIIRLSFIAAFFVISISCNTSKRVVYFQGIDNYPEYSIAKDNIEFKIMPNDILDIEVTTPLDDAVSQTNMDLTIGANVFASANSKSASNREALKINGYIVDENGCIQYPLLGFVKLGGLTRVEAEKFMIAKIGEFKREPSVRIKFLNKKVSVLGEVKMPGVINLDADRMSVLEAIAIAGDLNIQGRRKDVLVLRQNNGKVEYGRLDLTNSNIFQSPYFWLAPEDIVYIAPNKTKAVSAEWQVAAYAISGVSLLITILALIKK